jgi:diguanylate cyclase (GGDEF)-like protein
MKRAIAAVAVSIGCAMACLAEQPAALASLRAIHALSNSDASQTVPVSFEATVTYFRSYEKTLFVQDGDAAIYVAANTGVKLVPGDRVRIKGTVRPSFHPAVDSSDIVLLHHGAPPRALAASYDDLLDESLDCRLVAVRGVVRSADLILSSDRANTSIQVLSGGRTIDEEVDSSDPDALKGLLDAEVEIVGAVSGKFDGKMQRVGIVLHSQSLADVRILKRPGDNPWRLPLSPMDAVLGGYRVEDSSRRIRVRGTITYYEPGSAAVLQNGSKSLWISTLTREPLRIGDVADATGFPDVRGGFLTLTRAEIEDGLVPAPVAPVAVAWKELLSGAHIFDLVSIQGEVLAEVRAASRDEYLLMVDGRLMTAVYRHPTATSLVSLPPMKRVPIGSKVRVAGICIAENSNPFDYDQAFNILIRSFGDIAVVDEAPWWNVRTLAGMVFLLLLAVIAVGAWGWIQARKVQKQTTAIAVRNEAEAALERRRSAILEDINGTRPLDEILEEISGLVASRLEGAPCWFQLADESRLGNPPSESAGLRIVRTGIHDRSGQLFGELFAGLERRSVPRANESEALAVGAGLAMLAVETRRLYSDLLHRSEFDLLTDIHNRFSLNGKMEALIEDSLLDGPVFGLIYIDLDGFKQINDLHGHQIGDQYLHDVALRMKAQLRGVDMLARLGGDEFAALVTAVRCRAEVEEVAKRIEECFDDPFAVDGRVLYGSASVGIAFFPEDGSTKDTLFSAADAAMYAAKNAKRQAGESAVGRSQP